ncbi:hypothetical protein [Hansschlegelia zhihuaiae]|uniref:Uncharacterized protein n=1 Tax=Hansschlegelia zhihuaiae TaxID=405005 RepID=A0A4Q0ML81_9HYPH|nr:hypothetical protein [Hansschlegelia zhihuaiae]RXF74471.1 hypothetical protein EK403_06595 [Hansschlegelia zhihuaiae]
MRSLNEALSSIEIRRGARLWVVSLCEPDQAAKLAEIKSAKHKLIELDLSNATGRSSKTANGVKEATDWRPLSNALLEGFLAARPADSTAALNIRNWLLLVKTLNHQKLSLAGADVIAVRVPLFREGAHRDPMSGVVRLLTEAGFRISELALAPGKAATEMIYVVCERTTKWATVETRWHAKGDGPSLSDPLVENELGFPAAAKPALENDRPPYAAPSAATGQSPEPFQALAGPSSETVKPEEALGHGAPATRADGPNLSRAPSSPGRNQFAAPLAVSSATVAFHNGFAQGTLSLATEAAGPVQICVCAEDGSPITIGAAHPVSAASKRDLAFRVWSSSPEPLAQAGSATKVAAFVMPSAAVIRLRAAPAPPPETMPERASFGILVVYHSRQEAFRATLRSLSMQDAQPLTHVWLDGDQGRPDQRALVVANADAARAAGFANVTPLRGRAGPQKLMIHALMAMCQRYDAFLVLEENCFPNRSAVKVFQEELRRHETDPSIFSVYGHPFGLEAPDARWGRFQNWGWATWSDRLRPLLPQLAHLSSLDEPSYLAWTAEQLTPEIREYIEVTPGRQPTTILTRYFDWSETLGLIAALNGFSHVATQKRVVYACESSRHSRGQDINWYRRPPYNMIDVEEAWKNY